MLTPTYLFIVKDGNFILDQDQGQTVLHGHRNQVDRLWDIELPQSTEKFSAPTSKNNTFHIENVTPNVLNSTINYFTHQDIQSSIPTTSSTIHPSSIQPKINVII